MEFKDNITGEKAIYKTEFDIKIEGNKLVLNYSAKHSKFYSYSDKFNDDIYKGDVVAMQDTTVVLIPKEIKSQKEKIMMKKKR